MNKISLNNYNVKWTRTKDFGGREYLLTILPFDHKCRVYEKRKSFDYNFSKKYITGDNVTGKVYSLKKIEEIIKTLLENYINKELIKISED